MKDCQKTFQNFHIMYQVVRQHYALILLNCMNITSLPIHGTNCKEVRNMALTAKKVYAVLNSKIKAMEEKMKQPITYKGKVDTADLLPLSPSIGDMYNISQTSTYGGANTNVVWNGTIWDSLGSITDVTDEQIQEAVNQFLTQNPIAPTLTDDGILIL
nr:MAG TPA: hypothetical protein [Caudoviricetes sp.]